ncbi:MAG TPA: polysaccharide biosynthesis tyrosine autokinase [Gammaproteobacteria bacterium]|nr:polysaccharide biosynthesis tyrosine autokinase [Gammaproteobacteria bacterium]
MSQATQNPPPQTEPEVQEIVEDELDLRRLVDMLWAGKWLIAAVTAVALAIGLAYAVLAPPRYTADALLQVEQNQPSLLDNTALGQLTGQAPKADTQIQILKSRLVLGKAVDQLDLTITARPHYFPVVGAWMARHADTGDRPAAPFLGLSSYAWGGTKIDVTRLSVPRDLEGKTLTLVAGQGDAYRLLDPDGKLLLKGQVGKPAYSSEKGPDGRPAVAAFVQTLVARPGTRFDVAKHDRLATIDALQKHLGANEEGKGTGIIHASFTGHSPQRAKNILNAVADAFLRQNVQRHSEQAADSLKFLNQQLPKLKDQMNTAEQKLASYRSQHRAVDLTAETKNLLDQIVNVEDQINTAQLKRAKMSEEYNPQHPQMKALANEIAKLKGMKQSLEQKVKGLPNTQQQMLSLERDEQVNTTLYTDLLNKAQELQIQKAGTTGNVRIVDHAVKPDLPSGPNRKSAVLLSLFLGLLAGVGLVFGRETLRRGITNPEDLEKRIGVPVYGVIPHSKAQARLFRQMEKGKAGEGTILAGVAGRDPAVEALRSLRTSLHFALMDAERRIVVFTGPGPGVGKSFVSVNAAALLAEAGQKTLLIDADMRKGHIHQYAGVQRSPGLSDVLAGDLPWREAVVHLDGEQGADLLASGTIPPNPSELLMNERFGELLKEAAKEYGVVLLDTPPVMAVTDATLIAPWAAALFVVVRAGQSAYGEIEQTLKRLERNRSRVAGLLFNDLGASTAGGYSYGYYYYHYKYGH